MIDALLRRLLPPEYTSLRLWLASSEIVVDETDEAVVESETMRQTDELRNRQAPATLAPSHAPALRSKRGHVEAAYPRW